MFSVALTLERKREEKEVLREIFETIIEPLLNYDILQKINTERHHSNISRLKHCYDVAFRGFIIANKLGWRREAIAKAGILHDLFTDKESKEHRGRMFVVHPKIALDNAKKVTTLDKIEKDIILKHMFPLCLGVPRYKESWLISGIDKYYCIKEHILSILRAFTDNRKCS